MKLIADNHGAPRMNPNNLDDHLTFNKETPAGQIFLINLGNV